MRTTTDVRHESTQGPHALEYALQFLLIAAFVTGGSSQISGWDDAFVQLLSLPILGFALWRISGVPGSTSRNVALGVAALIALVPFLQLLPVPDSLWHLPEARQRLAGDMAAVGAIAELRWSLDPAATERAFLFLMPPLAAFAATVSMRRDAHLRLLRTVMLLALFSLLLAFAQLGVPAESLLNPFPRWAAQLNGVFANQNHQGISLVLAIIIALSAMLVSLPRTGESRRQAWIPWLYGFVALFALCALPLTNSRASVLLAVFAVAAVPLALGYFKPAHVRHHWRARVGLAGCVGLIALGIWGSIGWMQASAVDELRSGLRAAALSMGIRHAPLGSGVGSFVATFEQAAPPQLLLPNYINHVHNEFLQWWIEAGWLGMLVLAASLAALARAAASTLRTTSPDRAPGVVALLGLTALLAHSWVDYPLRTVSLATVAAVLAGILVAQAGRRRTSAGLRVAERSGLPSDH